MRSVVRTTRDSARRAAGGPATAPFFVLKSTK
jgi:hypothetical protein